VELHFEPLPRVRLDPSAVDALVLLIRPSIPELVQLLLRSIAQELGRPNLSISAQVITAMQAYHWPGNIREMRNVLERAVLLSKTGDLVEVALEDSAGNAPSARGSLEAAEREEIQRVLQEQKWNITSTAKLLGISRSGLYTKIKQYDLRPVNGHPVQN